MSNQDNSESSARDFILNLARELFIRHEDMTPTDCLKCAVSFANESVKFFASFDNKEVADDDH